MYPNRENNYCCGAGGGAWAMSFNEERVFHGRIKAAQIRKTGAEMVIAPCHNCRDQIMKSLNKEYNLGVEVKYLWELVADSLILPGGAKPRAQGEEN
jgi:Fe-S oxidoreductase